MDLQKTIGLKRRGARVTSAAPSEHALTQYINLKLAYLGCPAVQGDSDTEFDAMAASLLLHHQETDRLLADYLCPADQRIQNYITAYLAPANTDALLPRQTFVLDRHGLARALSLPPGRDEFVSDIVSSYRVKQGVLHNPKSDRRTTEGIFHVAEGGLGIPDDKKGVPRAVFGQMLRLALDAPAELLRLPFTAAQSKQAECFVSLLLRPVVRPAVPGGDPARTMEVRFFVPGNLVGNLDFVESIFGNAGDPYLPENDAALDAEHWSGHSGCVILAPHLVRVTKRQAGLPQWDFATERQRRDGMCWKSEDELYNDGGAFKLTCRDEQGVIVTLIADNYFGYCKKEVKTQISYAANLSGLSEEEHAGGALVFPSQNLPREWDGDQHIPQGDYTYEGALVLLGDTVDARPEGYALDKNFPDIVYVSEHARFDLDAQSVTWGADQKLRLMPDKTYVRPSGYKLRMEKVPNTQAWRLIGTMAEGTFCHKPCTVSGGGKSEISKPLTDAVLQGPVYVADFAQDFDQVAAIIDRDYGDRFIDPQWRKTGGRPLLSPERSLGSVIKLLTPASREYAADYNAWLHGIPYGIKELVFVVKRFYRPEWGDNWREHFSVDIINGTPGHVLRCDGRQLVASFLRVGYEPDGAWRTFGLRQDFQAAVKVAREDDITASVVVPREAVKHLDPAYKAPAVKFAHNCEFRLFQRPDDAIHRGYDKLTEQDFSQPGNFLSNWEPLPASEAQDLIDDAIGFDLFTPPMQNLIKDVAATGKPSYFVSSAHPRIVDGKPTKNPRYLQVRPDLVHPDTPYLAEVGVRLHRRIPQGDPVPLPVNAVLPGRRNNPPDPAAGVRPLSVFNPIHYLPTPELFIEYISSMTGKSPSTTGAGSEGALTKGPFNALLPILDLNNALVAHLVAPSPTPSSPPPVTSARICAWTTTSACSSRKSGHACPPPSATPNI